MIDTSHFAKPELYEQVVRFSMDRVFSQFSRKEDAIKIISILHSIQSGSFGRLIDPTIAENLYIALEPENGQFWRYTDANPPIDSYEYHRVIAYLKQSVLTR